MSTEYCTKKRQKTITTVYLPILKETDLIYIFEVAFHYSSHGCYVKSQRSMSCQWRNLVLNVLDFILVLFMLLGKGRIKKSCKVQPSHNGICWKIA